MHRHCIIFLAALTALAACGQNSTLGPSPASGARPPRAMRPLSGTSSKIQHVVIIFQENRSINDLFNGLPGAGTVRVGKNSLGRSVTLLPRLLTAPYDISHQHSAFVTEYDGGKLDGFNLVYSVCLKQQKACPPADIRAYAYVPEKDVEPYFIMARRYAFARNMFQTNQGPSFPAHQYILSGTSTISNSSSLRAAENPLTTKKKLTGGCDSPKGSLVWLIDPKGREKRQIYPCFDRNSLIAPIEAQSLTWRYYQAHLGPGLWEGPDAILPVYNSSEFSTDVVAPPSQVLTDIANGNLANVAWVTPTAAASDHPGITDGSGPSWVASVVNAIGKSQYWNDTAIFVTWDDWGGWYDPAPPHQYNSYELGFRVPLVVISPYAKPHYISTKQHEFGSILKFTENAFNLGSLGTTDVRSDDLSDCFDFSKPPRKFVPIPAPRGSDYFLRQPASAQNPDDDF
ncbi:MAG TPA: alkaline phosphatase family protein [Candidatus Cybelea sp.]